MVTHHNYPLSELLYYRIGGKARYVLEAKNRDDILEALDFVKKNKIEQFLVVGLGSNLLLPDSDFDGAVIWFCKPETQDIAIDSSGLVSAFAGQTLDDLIQFGFLHNLIGIESLGGLPSTIGGAIRGNAGAFGTEMEDVVEKVEVLDLASGQIKQMTNADCHFSYRNSLFKENHNLVILRGYFRLRSAMDEEVAAAKKVYQEKIDYRNINHPVEYPSCGSIFKNIREKEKVEKMLSVWPDMKESVENKWHGKVSMGYAIKRLGFSGTQVGGAKITEKHANYISNVNNAKAEEVLAIIEQIKEKFNAIFGFSPELEAEIVS